MTNAALPGGETGPPRTRERPLSEHPGDQGRDRDEVARPRLLRGLAYGVGMAIAFAGAWVVLKSILDLSVGLVFLSAIAAWLTGTAVALGAEPGSFRRQRSTMLLAMAVCVGIWFFGSYAAYLVSLAILPESTLDLFGRMTNAPFVDVLAADFIPGGPIELATLAVFGWLGAR